MVHRWVASQGTSIASHRRCSSYLKKLLSTTFYASTQANSFHTPSSTLSSVFACPCTTSAPLLCLSWRSLHDFCLQFSNNYSDKFGVEDCGIRPNPEMITVLKTPVCDYG